MKTNFQYEIISKLRKYREDFGYSQQKIGELLGLSNGQIGNIESFYRPHKFTLRQIVELCGIYDIRIEQLFLEENDYINNDIIDTLIKKIVDYER